MRVPRELFAPGAMIGLKEIPCPQCKADVHFNIVHLVTLCDQAAPLLELLFRRDYYEIQCELCGAELTAGWFPVIVVCEEMNLLIYATPGADDGGLEEGFRHYLRPLLSWGDDSFREKLTNWPFVAVYGQQGLARILAELGEHSMDWSRDVSGRNWRPTSPWERGGTTIPKVWQIPSDRPVDDASMTVSVDGDELDIRILHAATTGVHAKMRDGYLYGGLMFYYPAQRHIEPAVHLFLSFSTSASTAQDKRSVYSEFSRTGLSESSHPWVLNEMARLALELQDEHAPTILDRMVSCESAWLGITAAFLDATPRRRTAEEAIMPDLTTREVRALRQAVTTQRHVVTQIAPFVADYGFWAFPFTEQVAAATAYSAQQIGRVQGATLGVAERMVDTGRAPAGRSYAFEINRATEGALPYLGHDEICEFFWESYLSFRFGDEIWRPGGGKRVAEEMRRRAESAGGGHEAQFLQHALRWLSR